MFTPSQEQIKDQLLFGDLDQLNVNLLEATPEDFDCALCQLLPEAQAEYELWVTADHTDKPYTDIFENCCPKAEQLFHVWHLLGVRVDCTDNLPPNDDCLHFSQVQDNHQTALSLFSTALSTDKRGFNIYERFAESPAFGACTAEQQEYIIKTIKNFQSSGVHLSEELKTRLGEINSELSALSNQFRVNVGATRNKQRVTFKSDELTGVPDRVMANMLLPNGKYLASIENGGIWDVLAYAENKTTRRKAHNITRKHTPTKEPHDNTSIVKRIMELRFESAKLLGFDTPADMYLETRMASTPKEVIDFLDDISCKCIKTARKEDKILSKYGKMLLGGRINRADWSYVSTMFEQSTFDVDYEAIREYFPIDTVFSGLFKLIKRLYGIDFERVTDHVPAKWHEDVVVYAAKENDSILGYIFADCFARPEKRNGAWMDNLVTNGTTQAGQKILPIASLTCNFTKGASVDTPPTLSLGEVNTLFHEMGHCLHHLFGTGDVWALSGINGVEWDAVELPSQMMEYFCEQYDVLCDLSSKVVDPVGEKFPRHMFDALQKSKLFGVADVCVRQNKQAKIDMMLHITNTEDPHALELQIRKEFSISPRKIDEKYSLLSSFSHIFAGGYSAGYYSYKWAEVLAADAFAAFEEAYYDDGNALMDIASEFRRHVLSSGGSGNMADKYRAFRGKDPDIDHMLRYMGILPKP